MSFAPELEVLKKRSLTARKEPGLVNLILFSKFHTATAYIYMTVMPDNPIIDTSIRLYEEKRRDTLISGFFKTAKSPFQPVPPSLMREGSEKEPCLKT